MALPKVSDRRFTYADYLKWPDDERWELMDGEAYAMSPTPTISHQTLVLDIARQIADALDGAPCRALIAPVDVLLPAPEEADDRATTVVQPDILVVCDPAKITERNVRGAPDWFIEVLSPRHRPPRPPHQARALRTRRCPRILAGTPGRPRHHGLRAERRPIWWPGNRRHGRRTRPDGFPGDRDSLATDSGQVAN